MEITITLNGKTITRSILPDTLLIDFVRSEHCLSVKRGCDTSNCGLCTVLLDNKPVLSCSVLAARAAGLSHWRACRERRRNLEVSWQMKARNSVVSVILDL